MNVAAKIDHGDYRNGSELDHATIHVVKKEPPGQGKKTGSVNDGISKGWFRALPKILNQLQVGQTYEIEYRQGDSARFIDSAMLVVAEESPAVAHKITKAVRQAQPTPQPVPQHYDEPAPVLTMRDLTKDEQIFIEGALNRAIQVHQTSVHNVDDMISVVRNLHQVWSSAIE